MYRTRKKYSLNEFILKILPAIIIAFKIFAAGFFSSDYTNTLFIPFVQKFLEFNGNPWFFFANLGQWDSFPYPPGMLLILSFPVFLLSFFQNIFIRNLIFKIPFFLADFLIYKLLLELCRNRKLATTIYYLSSPIIIYAIYMHSQVDLIPTALLFLSVVLLFKKKLLLSSCIFTFTILTKTHAIAALPLLFIYIYKKYSLRKSLKYTFFSCVLFLLGNISFWNENYFRMVFQNTEQNKLFSLSISFGNNTSAYLLITIFVIFYIYVFMLKKINQELFLCYLGLIFSLFVLLVPPMSGWYVWCLPYLCYFYISSNIDKKYKLFTYGLLNIFYLLYFVFFTQKEGYVDLYFLQTPLTFLKVSNPFFKNIIFSCLEAVLLLNIYQLVHYGITSNSLYKTSHESFVIGIGGDSGAGKSTLLKSIYDLLGENNILELEGDGDHRWERGDENWSVYTHLNPKANLIYQQMADIEQLKLQKSIRRRDYDHDTGKFTAPKSISSKNYIILSGLHVFYLPKMRRLIDLKIFLDTDEKLRKHWKIIRDTNSRGYSQEEILKSIDQRQGDSEKYIQPQKQFADLEIHYYDPFLTNMGDPDHIVEIFVRYTMNSNVNLEPLLNVLSENNIQYVHDYSDDLCSQILDLQQSEFSINFEEVSKLMIPNYEELLIENPQWEKNISGVNQLIIYKMISQCMKEELKS